MYEAVTKAGEVLGEVRLRVPGTHNALNSLGALMLARQCGVSMEHILQALAKFTGAKRRFETKGHEKGIWVVDDYAHHPTEINATLSAAKALESHRVVCIFQPHRFTRTSLLLKEFGTAFEKADVLYITNIYSAGEDPIAGIDGHSIPDMVKSMTGKEVHYIDNVDDVPAVVAPALKADDLVITMGAGSISLYGPKLLDILKREA